MSDAGRMWTRARRAGDLPVSLVLIRAVGSIALLASLPALGGSVWRQAVVAVEIALTRVANHVGAAETSHILVDVSPWSVVGAVLAGVVPISTLLCALTLAGGLVQTRGWFGRPSARSRASHPRESHGTWASAAPVLISVALLFGTTAWLLGAPMEAFASPGTSLSAQGRRLIGLLRNLALPFAGVALATAALDIFLVRRLWRKRNELDALAARRERRQREVAPEVRAALRQVHRGALGGHD